MKKAHVKAKHASKSKKSEHKLEHKIDSAIKAAKPVHAKSVKKTSASKHDEHKIEREINSAIKSAKPAHTKSDKKAKHSKKATVELKKVKSPNTKKPTGASALVASIATIIAASAMLFWLFMYIFTQWCNRYMRTS